MRNSQKNLICDFTSGSVSKQLIAFSAPLFLSNLLQVVYNMVDMIIVGHVNGEVGISAVSVGGDVSAFLTFIAIGFSSAGQVIISQYIGANRRELLGKFIGTMFTFLISCALFLSCVCLILRVPILSVMNTPPDAFSQTLSYATICMTGLVFIYGYNIVGAILRGMGDSVHPFIFISIAAILNIVLDLVFVCLMHMGAAGAALATVISQAVSFFACAILLWKSRSRLGFDLLAKDIIYINPQMLLSLVRLGIPMAIKNASIQFSKLFVNSWVNSYGVVVSALAGIANKFTSISNILSNSINAAGSSMVGQNVGAGEFKRVPRIMLTSFGITFCLSAVMSLSVVLFPRQIFSIFTSEAAVLEIAMQYIPIAVLMFFGSCCRAPMNALINGSGNYKVNFATALLDGIVMRIGLSSLFGIWLGMGYLGFWLGDALAGFTPLFIGAVYYISGRWKVNKYVVCSK